MKKKIKERNSAQRKAAQTQNINDWEEYKKIRNCINNTQKQEELGKKKS